MIATVLRVGLTGGTGAGKSTAARRLAALGAVVADADAVAREVVAPGSDGLRAVLEEFGPAVGSLGGGLDRAALAAVVFADAERRRALEALTHPRIAARTAELVAGAPRDAVVVHDVPLLVEKGMGPGYHLVVVVDAPDEVRVRRLVARGMPADDARRRIASQASAAEREAAADVVVDNSGPAHALEATVERLWRRRLVPFEENVRLRRRVRRSEQLRLVPPDATWPAQAARLASRVARAAGERGRGVEHVGSTAVAGLVAKDVIDLQLAVPSPDDADAIADALADSGFPAAPGEWHDHAKGGGGATWPKRLHGGADPARVVHLHVREHGSPGWRWALLFRDALREDAGLRQDYAAEKQRLAAQGLTTSEYAAGKEPWFDRVAPRLEQWAERTGWRPPSS